MGALRLARAGLVVLGLLGGPALAERGAFDDWSFDVKRAEGKADLAALGQLAAAQPGFARVWFYGQVFDLVTPGVPDAVRDQLRPRLEAIAEALAAAPTSDVLPRLYLDRARSGALTADAATARQMQTDAVNAVRGGTPIGATLAAAARPDLAEWVYHTLLYRAAISATRLGGADEAAALLLTARRAAEGFALALDDLQPFKTLLAWYGPAGLPEERAFLELEIDKALMKQVAGDAAGAKAGLARALDVARQSRGPDLMTALVQNGLANAEGAAGDRNTEKQIRSQVLQAVRPLGRPELTALVAGQLVDAHLEAGTLTEAVPHTAALRALGTAVSEVRQRLLLLGRAREAFARGADTALAAGRLVEAETLLSEASALGEILASEPAVARTTPAAEAGTERARRQADRAELGRRAGRIALRRGRFEEARAAFDAAVKVYAVDLQRPPAAGAAQVDVAEHARRTGDLPGALAATAAALQALPTGAPEHAEDRAAAYAVQGTARLHRGEHTAAFANANAGLEALRAHGRLEAAPALRARLHGLAGAALHAAGFGDEVRVRYAQATAFDRDDADLAQTAALANLEGGDVEAALEALTGPATGPQERALSYARGCVLARAGRLDQALPLLQSAPGLGLPALENARLVGSACLAAAQIARKDFGAAQRSLGPVRALALDAGADPVLAWRLLELDAAAHAGVGDWPTAARRSLAAAEVLDRLLNERAARGQSLDLGVLALPADASSLRAEGVHRCLKAAARGGPEAPGFVEAGLRLSRYFQALAATEPASAPVAGQPPYEAGVRPAEAEAPVRAALATLGNLRQQLGDPSVDGADREALVAARVAAAAALGPARQALADAAPAFDAFAAPRLPEASALAAPAGEARIYTHFDAHGGHLWLALPGQPLRHQALPTAAALSAALAPAWQVIATPPKPFAPAAKRPKDPNAEAYEALAAPVAGHLAFLRDPALAGLRLAVYGDGPLTRFPLGALVLEPAPSPGAPPVFVAARHAVRHRLGGRPIPRSAAGAGTHALGAVGLDAACPAGPGGLDLCAGADLKREQDEVAAAFAMAPDAFRAVDPAAHTPAGFNAALQGAATLLVSGPVDADAGAILLTAGPDGRLARLGGTALGMGPPGGASQAVLTRLSEGDRAAGVGLQRLVRALNHRGVERVVLNVARAATDAERLGSLAARLAAGEALEAAVENQQRFDREAAVDLTAGGLPSHHPHVWARLLLVE